jgi:3-methylcrotonyl-CoA carboxylase alpha subunit
MFGKLLVANRGEIACRVIASCRRLGVRTVAVYSDADAQARHVRLADEAVCIGAAPARASYLRGEAILAAALASGAEAIHPGYGFLSENAGFADACLAAGVTFIGPTPAAIRAMGSKSAAKQLMQAARVPLVPGYHGDAQDLATLQREAGRIGYPVLIKASAGGGGKGMRIVQDAAQFAEALASCQREALASFGNQHVLLERYLLRPRHIEVQVFGDTQGQVLSLFERDCSAQRRHQKVIEEAPACHLGERDRQAMAQAARDAARAVGYVGAGTVEFIVDQSGAFYFMEMNTRLQVEHPVTEMVTGLDLVEWQLRVAAGEPLPPWQEQLQCHGHAIEVRLYAEEPDKGFLPSIGTVAHFRLPAETRNVRVDTGIEAGDVVGPHYDPMLAKLIVWDETRAAAIAQLQRALGAVQIAGVGNNLAFLQRLVAHEAFAAGAIDTGFIERSGDSLLGAGAALPVGTLQAAALWVLLRERATLHAASAATQDPHSPWAQGADWRLNGSLQRQLRFRHGDAGLAVAVEYAADGLRLDGGPVTHATLQGSALACHWAGQRHKADVVELGGQLHVFIAGGSAVLSRDDLLAHADVAAEHHGGLVAPMSGAVIALCVAPGAPVERGEALLVMEAMKMEHTLRAPAAGSVRAFHCRVGEQVREGAELLDFEAQP